MSDTSDTDQGNDDRDPAKTIRQATGFDDGATIAATDADQSNDERYPAGAQTGDTDADTGNTEGQGSST